MIIMDTFGQTCNQSEQETCDMALSCWKKKKTSAALLYSCCPILDTEINSAQAGSAGNLSE